MAEIRPLFGDVVTAQSSLPRIIEHLENVLERARLGEVRAIALVWIDGGDGSYRHWDNGDKLNSQLLGQIVDLQYQFMKAWNSV